MNASIALDVTSAVTQRAGVARYIRGLIAALTQLPDGPQLRPFFVASHTQHKLGVGPAPSAMPRSIRAWYLEMAAHQLLRWSARGPWDGAQVYHALDVVYPPVRHIPVVMTVHDLSYCVYPHFHTRFYGSYMRMLTPTLTRRARLIIADSHSTKRDLVERVHVPEQKIRVIHLGLSDPFTRETDPSTIQAVRQSYGLTDDFILSVGTVEPRKNLAGTLRAYDLLRQRMPDVPVLALVGGSGWGVDEQNVLNATRTTHVRRLGYVPDEDVAALYAACSAFVYPSFYEGFGLPLLEAISLGAPTITSNVSSMPEVVGDAALLVNPHDPDELADALMRILNDSALTRTLRLAGPRQARAFSYDRVAQETMRVYEEVIDD